MGKALVCNPIVIDQYANNINLTAFKQKVDTTVRGRDGYGRVQDIMVFSLKDINLIKSANDWYCVLRIIGNSLLCIQHFISIVSINICL